MNKQQKRELVKRRRFAQKMNKITSKLLLVDTETGGLEGQAPPHYEPNKALIAKCSVRELEYLLNMEGMTAEGYNELIHSAIHAEYTERMLLREKNKQN